MLLELTLILIFSWLIRSAFTVSEKLSVLSDSYAHLFMIKTQQGHRFFNFNFDGTVAETTLGYPKLQHFIISRFPEKSWAWLGGFLTILYDLIWITLFYLLIQHYQPIAEQQITLMSPAFWGALLFSTTPILIPITARLTGLGNARTLGGLLNFCLLCCWLLITPQQLAWYLPATLLCMLLIIWSSSFGLQVAIFNAIFVSLLSRDPLPVLSVAGSIGLLFVLPVGVRQIMVHKFQHWVWYFRNSKRGTSANKRNTPLRDFVKLPVYLLTNRREFGESIAFRLTPIIALYSIPAVVAVAYWYFQGFRFSEPGLVAFSAMVFASSLLAFALTSIPWFTFLGEAERYLECASPFLIVLFLQLIAEQKLPQTSLLFLLLIQLSVICAIYLYRNRSHLSSSFLSRSMTREVKEVQKFFKRKTKREHRVLTIPIKTAFFWGFLTHGLEHIKFYQTFMGSASGFRSMEEETDVENMGWPKTDLSMFQSRYGVNKILLHKLSDRRFAEAVEKYQLEQYEKIFENAEFAIYDLGE
jgi:hypothetical protein